MFIPYVMPLICFWTSWISLVQVAFLFILVELMVYWCMIVNYNLWPRFLRFCSPIIIFLLFLKTLMSWNWLRNRLSVWQKRINSASLEPFVPLYYVPKRTSNIQLLIQWHVVQSFLMYTSEVPAGNPFAKFLGIFFFCNIVIVSVKLPST